MWLPVRLPSWAIPFLTLQNRTELPPIFCLAVLGPSGGLPSSAMPLLTLKNKTELSPILFFRASLTRHFSSVLHEIFFECPSRDDFRASLTVSQTSSSASPKIEQMARKSIKKMHTKSTSRSPGSNATLFFGGRLSSMTSIVLTP